MPANRPGKPQRLHFQPYRHFPERHRFKGNDDVFNDLNGYSDFVCKTLLKSVSVRSSEFSGYFLRLEYRAVIIGARPIDVDFDSGAVLGGSRQSFGKVKLTKRRVVCGFDALRRFNLNNYFWHYNFRFNCNICLESRRIRQIIVLFRQRNHARYSLSARLFGVVVFRVPDYAKLRLDSIFIGSRQRRGKRQFTERGAEFDFAKVNRLHRDNSRTHKLCRQFVVIGGHREGVCGVAGNQPFSVIPAIEGIPLFGSSYDSNRLVIKEGTFTGNAAALACNQCQGVVFFGKCPLRRQRHILCH